MDIRILIIFGPVIIAASWALYNVGRVALRQLKKITT